MQCKQLEAVLEQEGLAPLSAEVKEHLAECAACQSFVADISLIVEKAHELPAEVEPPQRIWLSVQAQLHAEGLIHEPVEVPGIVDAPWWQNLAEIFRPRNLLAAGATVALIFVVTTQVRKSTPNIQATKNAAQNNHPQTQPNTANLPKPSITTLTPLGEQARVQPRLQLPTAAPVAQNMVAVSRPDLAGARPASSAALRPSPSEAAFAASSVALNEAEQSLPSSSLEGNTDAEASLRQNLRTVNEFIAECEQHLKQHPQDQLAREYLSSAYQQKAELIAALLDSGRSEH